MSNHDVTVETIEQVYAHPNADKLEIVNLFDKSHVIVVEKDKYKPQDKVLFIQDDLILPYPMVKYFDLSFLDKGRVKQTKLRGIVSQALILPVEEVQQFDERFNYIYSNYHEDGKNYAKVLGIHRKHTHNTGQSAGALPDFLEKYDLDNNERNPYLHKSLVGEYVLITEKLEGTNCSVVVTPTSASFYSRTQKKQDGFYVDVPKEQGIVEKGRKILSDNPDWEYITFRGEIIGPKIQGNIYELTTKRFEVFDIKIGKGYSSYYLSEFDKYNMCLDYDIRHVPFLYGSMLEGDMDLVKFSNRKSAINPNVDAEGIVIAALHGIRIKFKQRSPEYLAKQK